MRKTVEGTLNALLDEETSELVGAERYRRRETSVEEAIVELYLVGVSTRRIEDVSELLWGGRCPPAPSPTSTRGPSHPSGPDGRCRSMATTPSFSSTASASSAAGEDPTRTRPCRSPSASTPSAAGRSSAAPRDTPSRPTSGACSSPGSGGAGSPACGSSPATGARGRSVRSRRCSPGPAAGAARCIFNATCWEGFP